MPVMRSNPRSPLGDGKAMINALMMLETTNTLKVLKVSLLDPIRIVKINNVIIDIVQATKGPRPPENQIPASCILSATTMTGNDGHQTEFRLI